MVQMVVRAVFKGGGVVCVCVSLAAKPTASGIY